MMVPGTMSEGGPQNFQDFQCVSCLYSHVYKLQTERLFACLSCLTLGWLGTSGLGFRNNFSSCPLFWLFIDFLHLSHFTSTNVSQCSSHAATQRQEWHHHYQLQNRFPLHFNLSQVFLVPTSLMLFPHPNSQKKTWKLTNQAGLDPSKFQLLPPIRRTLTHVAPVCRTALDLRQDLQTSMVDYVHDLTINLSSGDIFQKGWKQTKTRELGKLPIFKTNHVANRAMVLMVQRY